MNTQRVSVNLSGIGDGTFKARRTAAVSSAAGTYPTIHSYDVNNDGYECTVDAVELSSSGIKIQAIQASL